MQAFLTWSGTTSHEIASFFRGWLTEVLPGLQPWISSEDIAKGKKWFPELMGQLGKTSVSITFITPENVRSPWIYYEAGVIAAKDEECIICPYLVGVAPNQVRDTPLGQFQCTSSDKDDTFRLIRSINETLGDARHDEQLLTANFNTRWPKLERRIERTLRTMLPIRDNVVAVEPSIEQQLSDEARQMLLAGAEGDGQICIFRDSEGFQIATNGKEMVPEQSPRKVALWKAAFNELRDSGLVEDVGYSGEIFELTKTGFEIADLVRSRM